MINNLASNANQFVKTNSGAILTTVAVAGTVSTAVLTGRAVLKSSYILQDEELSRKEKLDFVLKTHWKDLAPVAVSGGATVAAIVMANRVEARKAAAMAAAYGISERAFQEYKDKVISKVGDAKAQAIRDEIAQERVEKFPPENAQIIITGGGEVLCMDAWSGRYFESQMEEIHSAVNKVNHEILNHQYASLSTFYDYVGLPATDSSDLVGWNSNDLLEITVSTTMSPDNRPCLVVTFVNHPQEGYGRLY